MTTQHEKAVSPARLMTLFAERAAAGDVDGVLDLYEPDAVFTPAPGIEFRGRDEKREALVEFLKTRPLISYAGEPDVVEIRDLALVANVWSMTATAPDGGTIREGGTSADVIRRRSDGSWRILVDQPRGTPIA